MRKIAVVLCICLAGCYLPDNRDHSACAPQQDAAIQDAPAKAFVTDAEGGAGEWIPYSSTQGRALVEADILIGETAEMDPERLKYEALPPGNGGEGDELFGLKSANPKKSPSDFVSPSKGNSATGDQAAGYDEGAMRPRNRALVQRYFDSK